MLKAFSKLLGAQPEASMCTSTRIVCVTDSFCNAYEGKRGKYEECYFDSYYQSRRFLDCC